jgi:hypothetical protein
MQKVAYPVETVCWSVEWLTCQVIHCRLGWNRSWARAWLKGWLRGCVQGWMRDKLSRWDSTW